MRGSRPGGDPRAFALACLVVLMLMGMRSPGAPSRRRAMGPPGS